MLILITGNCRFKYHSAAAFLQSQQYAKGTSVIKPQEHTGLTCIIPTWDRPLPHHLGWVLNGQWFQNGSLIFGAGTERSCQESENQTTGTYYNLCDEN